ncbi:hypothetical protein KFK09_023370 [Dendrobium nobile]|uniref:Uncharacterized protein n=1 Tax=Dendrobium nobile TaxID=94219 RepID=A0A8T3AML8_DENNO|nr:hypothetical protein KFK09_023370 [Dendrobium nobile]
MARPNKESAIRKRSRRNQFCCQKGRTRSSAGRVRAEGRVRGGLVAGLFRRWRDCGPLEATATVW